MTGMRSHYSDMDHARRLIRKRIASERRARRWDFFRRHYGQEVITTSTVIGLVLVAGLVAGGWALAYGLTVSGIWTVALGALWASTKGLD